MLVGRKYWRFLLEDFLKYFICQRVINSLSFCVEFITSKLNVVGLHPRPAENFIKRRLLYFLTVFLKERSDEWRINSWRERIKLQNLGTSIKWARFLAEHGNHHFVVTSAEDEPDHWKVLHPGPERGLSIGFRIVNHLLEFIQANYDGDFPFRKEFT